MFSNLKKNFSFISISLHFLLISLTFSFIFSLLASLLLMFSSLVFHLLLSFIFSCLPVCLVSLSVSLSLSPSLSPCDLVRDVVLCCVCRCGRGVCLVCVCACCGALKKTWKKPVCGFKNAMCTFKTYPCLPAPSFRSLEAKWFD